MKTPYHARYHTFSLRQQSSGYQKYLSALSSARIDLHPHQIEAALFASAYTFTEGVILADEEGLGKTISAGIVLMDAILNDKQNLLVLCPKNLISHWKTELSTKFDIDTVQLGTPGIVLMPYTDAVKEVDAISKIIWDLCVLDEAHILANSQLTENSLSDTIQKALKGRRKLLLTATPMQNSLMDLYYLIRLVDDTAFGGSPELFKKKYIEDKSLRYELATRAQQICQRTLKKHAITMQLPARHVRTILIEPSLYEIELSKKMSLWFHREDLAAFPKIQEPYIRLTFWKLLASGTHALSTSLSKVINRLDDGDERNELITVRDMADNIPVTARMETFLKTVRESFTKLRASGAPKKIIVFSENKTTLKHIYEQLKNKYKVILSSPDTFESNLREFRGKGEILLSTDFLGKGIDLSFCSCVINYDVPWNVQKLEQRISRCHRYGQKHDVMVINFIDPSNRADRRLYTVLNKKLQKFDKVFGASETVLGELKTDTLDIDLRTEAEIKIASTQFTDDNRETIDEQIENAQNDLLSHFNEDVASRFKFYAEQIPDKIKAAEDILWDITKYALGGNAIIKDETRQIFMNSQNFNGERLSRLDFKMDADASRGEKYGFASPLARAAMKSCMDGDLSHGDITVFASNELPSGTHGTIGLWRGYTMSPAQYETFPILCGYTDDGRELADTDCDTIMNLDVKSWTGGRYDADDEKPRTDEHLENIKNQAFTDKQNEILISRNKALESEIIKIERWARDEIDAISIQPDNLDNEIRTLKQARDNVSSFGERFKLNKRLADLEKGKASASDKLSQQIKVVNHKKRTMIEDTKTKILPRFWADELFVLRFTVE